MSQQPPACVFFVACPPPLLLWHIKAKVEIAVSTCVSVVILRSFFMRGCQRICFFFSSLSLSQLFPHWSVLSSAAFVARPAPPTLTHTHTYTDTHPGCCCDAFGRGGAPLGALIGSRTHQKKAGGGRVGGAGGSLSLHALPSGAPPPPGVTLSCQQPLPVSNRLKVE